MIAYVDSDLQYRFANAAYAEWFDLTPETILGKTIPDILGPERWALVSRHLQRSLAGETVIYEAARKSIDGGAQVGGVVPHPGPHRAGYPSGRGDHRRLHPFHRYYPAQGVRGSIATKPARPGTRARGTIRHTQCATGPHRLA